MRGSALRVVLPQQDVAVAVHPPQHAGQCGREPAGEVALVRGNLQGRRERWGWGRRFFTECSIPLAGHDLEKPSVMHAAVVRLRNAVANAVAVTVAGNGLELHEGGASVVFLLSAALLVGRVGSRSGAQRVPPSVTHPQAKAYIDEDHGEDHTQASEDGDQRQINGLQVLRGQVPWAGEERGGGRREGSFRNRRLPSGKKTSLFIRWGG